MASKADFSTDEWKNIVAAASNEGGIFGFGGQKVSDAEQQTLRQIAAILGVPTS